VNLPSESQLLSLALGGNSNVPLFTYSLPTINLNQQVINQTLAVLGTPIPGLTLEGSIVGNLTLQAGGTVGTLASAALSGNFTQGLFVQGANLSIGFSIGPAGSVDLGVNGASLVGYQVAGQYNVTVTASFSPGSFTVSTSQSNSVNCQWVGPTLDPSELGGQDINSVDPLVLITNLEVQGANSLLKQWGLPTIPHPGGIVGNLIKSL
jgi:hypothetical protein